MRGREYGLRHGLSACRVQGVPMKRLLRLFVVAAMVVGGSFAVAAPASASSVTVVGPGQSIQRAVDAAPAGGTVLLKPGVYRQSVLIRRGDIQLRGSGGSPGGTVIEPAASPVGFCAKNFTGICVSDLKRHTRIANIRINNLLVRNFRADGVIAFHTRNLIVENVYAQNNGEYGIARFDTTGGSLVTNLTTGSGEAGLYVGDSQPANVFVAGNKSWNNQWGLLYRHTQGAAIEYNDFHDNCLGVLMIAAPGPVGDARFANNTVRHNNKFCKGNPDEVPFNMQGGGLVLLGATGVVATHNAVYANTGSTPVSGGIVLQDGTPFGAGPSTGNTVTSNTAYHNSPADIVDHSGGTNTIRFNHCNRSQPHGLCHR